jgi:hypothetical protein
MDRRSIAIIIASLCSLASCTPDAAPHASVQVGDRLPMEWRSGSNAGSAAPVLVWVFRTDDCLTCQQLDYEVRRAQRRYGERLSVTAVHVGSERARKIPEAFLAERRVRASLITISPARSRVIVSDSMLPAVYLADRDVVLWSRSLRTGWKTLEAELDSALASAFGA